MRRIGRSTREVFANDTGYVDYVHKIDTPLRAGQVVETQLRVRRKDGSHFLARLRGAGVLPLTGLRVLAADNNPVDMLIATETFRRWGAEVLPAEHGAAAVQLAEQAERSGRRFDAVLMDLHMPVMNRLQATRALRERCAPGLAVIALTAAALTSERQLALDAGMDDFVTKPIGPLPFLTALQRLWFRRAA